MFYLDGYCAECPVNRVWKENECRCKDGYTDSTGRCVQQCKDGQLIDANGICYNCPLL